MARLRMAMIGGGPGAFIGPVHRIGAELDREIELVAGVFSSDPGRRRAASDDYRIDPARAYPDLTTMLATETASDDGVDFVSIVTPNANHLPSARAALAAGLAVMNDKPMTATLDEARTLADLVANAGLPYAPTSITAASNAFMSRMPSTAPEAARASMAAIRAGSTGRAGSARSVTDKSISAVSSKTGGI